MVYRIKEKSVLENFKAKITDLRKEGNYYFKGDYKFEIKGNRTYTQDIESYYIGDKITSIINVEKLYWNSENTDKNHNKSIKDFTYISSLLDPIFPIDLKYKKRRKI